MNQPEPLTYETPYKTVVINNPSGIKMVNGTEVLDGGQVKHNGKYVPLYVKTDKPELAAKIKTWRAEWDAYNSYKAAEFAANVPGLDELRSAIDAADREANRYHRQFNKMIEDENNDGVNPPAPTNKSLRAKADELAVKYPRAAIYLRAEGYTGSNNVSKYSAGKNAMEIIAAGGSIDDANDILANWLSKDIIE